MDSPVYTAPSVATWPALTNYGSIGGNGVYNPGTMPGSVSGPANPAGLPFTGVSGTVPQFSGVSSFADAGYAPAFNPTGAVPFTVTAMFRGNPADGRVNSIVGHSDYSWHIVLDTLGKIECQLGTASGSALTSAKVYNDGNWHQLVEIYTPATNPNVTGTNALYVDGVLDTAVNSVSTNGIGPGTNLDVLIGSDPEYTNSPAGVGRQFAGQVCEVALFTNALAASQIRALYTAAGEVVAPSIVIQPSASKSGGSIVFNVTANGTDPLAYQWYISSTTNYSDGAPLSDGGGVSGSTDASLTITDLQDYYFVVVTNNYGSITSAVASVAGSVPLITAQVPTTYANPFLLYPGFNHAFSVSAVGGLPLYYQWYTNGIAVGSATNASLTLTNVQTSFTISCVITNVFGTATNIWSASIVPVPAAPYPLAVVALNPTTYWRLDDVDDGANNEGAVCHEYVGGNDGLYTNVNLGFQGYNSTLDPLDTSMLVGNVATVNSDVDWIGTNIDFSASLGNSVEFTIEAWVALYANGGGGIVTKGYGGSEEACIDTGNGASHAFRFFVRTAGGTSVNANSTVVPQLNTTGDPSQNIWYHVVGVCDEAHTNLSLYINGTLASSANVNPGSGILNDSAWPMTIGSRASTQTSGNTIQVFGFINDVSVFNYALNAGQIAGEYAVGAEVAPIFIPGPPTNASAIANTTLTIPVTAIGTPPIGFVWSNTTTSAVLSSGTATNLATLNASLIYSNVPSAWNGDSVELTVTNAYGTTNIYVAISVSNGVNTNPTNIVFSVSGNQLTLSWPADHTGWLLQAQTNSLSTGLGTNWGNIAGSSSTNQINVPINTVNGSVFYRLFYP